MTKIQFIDEGDLPDYIHPSVRRRHPIDIDMNQALRENPGRWAVYPLSDRYPDIDHTTEAGFRKVINRVRVMTNNRKGGAYCAGAGESFETRGDYPNRRFFVRFVVEADQ